MRGAHLAAGRPYIFEAGGGRFTQRFVVNFSEIVHDINQIEERGKGSRSGGCRLNSQSSDLGNAWMIARPIAEKKNST